MLKKLVKNTPVLNTLAEHVYRRYLRNVMFPGSAAYWENRYAAGGTSGAGSYNRLAVYKAEVLSGMFREENIASVLELGCGDGHQLGLLEGYVSYIGLDVSPSAIERCIARYGDDATKSFFLYSPEHFLDRAGVFSAEAVLSLDVLYHLVEDEVFSRYMRTLFRMSRRFVIIYSSDYDEPQSLHVRDRNFTGWVDRHAPEWTLRKKYENPYPFDAADPDNTSRADFHVFERR